MTRRLSAAGLNRGRTCQILLPGKDPGSFFITIVISIFGGILGGLAGRRKKLAKR
jgi:hypothetical protein